MNPISGCGINIVIKFIFQKVFTDQNFVAEVKCKNYYKNDRENLFTIGLNYSMIVGEYVQATAGKKNMEAVKTASCICGYHAYKEV